VECEKELLHQFSLSIIPFGNKNQFIWINLQVEHNAPALQVTTSTILPVVQLENDTKILLTLDIREQVTLFPFLLAVPPQKPPVQSCFVVQ